MNIDFYSEFININFDNTINPLLINSENLYLTYKKKYLDNSFENYVKFKELQDEFDKLKALNLSINNTKYKFGYIDIVKINFLKQEIKNIVIFQRQLYSNFINYINYLNECSSSSPPEPQSLLSKILPPKSTRPSSIRSIRIPKNKNVNFAPKNSY
jgi:hypothetical protein